MSTSLIFKHLLDILKIESNLDGESSGSIGKEWLPHLVAGCADLRDSSAAADATTTNKDRLTILPKVLKCYSRLLNKAVSIPLNQIKHTKLVEAMIEGLVNLLNTLNQADKDTRLALQKVTIAEDSSLLMIFLHLITIYEAIGAQLSSDKATNAAVEDEHISELSLQLFDAILTAVHIITDDDVPAGQNEGVTNHKLNHAFSGPLATQAIHSLLGRCGHRAKRVSGLAATALLHTMRCFAWHRQVWRTCFPGAFSGLFVLTQSGYKSGSALLGGALACLLELTAIVTADTLPENVQLLTYLQSSNSSSVGSDGAGAGSAGGSSAVLFKNMLNKASTLPLTTTPATPTTSTTTSAPSTPQLVDPSPATELRTLEAYMQWRVALLQRIQLPLAVAVREVLKLSGPLQKAKLITQLGTLLCNCGATLGSVCVSECVAVLLSCTLDATPIVRSTTSSVWRSVQSSLQAKAHDGGGHAKVVDALGRMYFDLVGMLYGNVKLSNEVRVRDQLGVLLGVGYGVREHIVSLVRLYSGSGSGNSGGGGIIKCLSTLYMPDPAVCGVRVTASVLETRKYTYHLYQNQQQQQQQHQPGSTTASTEGGYYRVAWRHTQDNMCKEYADRWALFAGRHGLLEDILTAAAKCLDKLYYGTGRNNEGVGGNTSTELVVSGAASANTTSTTNSTSSTSHRALHTSAVVGALRLLNTAVLGLAAVAVRNDNCTEGNTAAPAPEVCSHCGKTGATSTSTTRTTSTTSTTSTSTALKMSRCSRCKAAHYCCALHQKLDWPTHKLTCKAAAAPPTVTTAATSTTDRNINTSSGDVNSPTDLLTSTNILVLPPTDTHDTATGTTTSAVTASSYSAVKKDFLMQRSVLLLLSIVQHYLSVRSTTVMAGSSSASPYTNTLVVAAALEGIGNVAYCAGADGFQKYLIKALYPLLEALVDTDAIVRQAAQCSLQRIALYVEGTSLQGLVRNNLDYIVDRVCMQLRCNAGSSGSSKGRAITTSTSTSTSTHLIVDFVFSTLDTTVQDSSSSGDEGTNGFSESRELSAPMHLLRDVICDALGSVDAYSAHSTYTALQLAALLRVLRVLACRAAAAPTVRGFVCGGKVDGGDGVLYVSKHLQDKIFAKTIPNNLTTPVVETTATTAPATTTTTTNTTNTAAHSAAASLLDFTRNLFNLTYTATATATDDNTTDTDPHEELLNAERIRAQIDAQNEKSIEDEYNTDSTTTSPPSASVHLLLDVVHRGSVFLALPHPASQVIVIETLCAAFVRLSTATNSKHHLLPCIHATWPVLMGRVRELVQVVVLTECANFSTVRNANLSTGVRGGMIGTLGGSAGDKRRGGSKVLLDLEGGVSSVSLTNSSSGSSSGGSSDVSGMGLSISSTTRRIDNTTNTSLHTTPTTINTISTSATNTTATTPPTTEQRSLLHVLPHLFDLLALLSVAGGEYMTIKLKQELLPLLYVLLRTYLQISIVSSGSGTSGSGGMNRSSSGAGGSVRAIADGGAVPSKVLSRSQLIITPASADDASTTSHATYTTNATDAASATNTTHNTGSPADRHSVHNKVKLSLLSLLTQLCTGSTSSTSSGTETQITRLMSTQVAPLVYLVLPLLGARECEEVREAAHRLLKSLHKLDSAAATALLRSVYYSGNGASSSAGESAESALQSWRALQHASSVVTALTASPVSSANATLGGSASGSGSGAGTSAVRSVVNADRVLSMYHKDRMLMGKVHALLGECDSGVRGASCGDVVHCIDSVWVQKLSLWSTV